MDVMESLEIWWELNTPRPWGPRPLRQPCRRNDAYDASFRVLALARTTRPARHKCALGDRIPRPCARLTWTSPLPLLLHRPRTDHRLTTARQ